MACTLSFEEADVGATLILLSENHQVLWYLRLDLNLPGYHQDHTATLLKQEVWYFHLIMQLSHVLKGSKKW